VDETFIGGKARNMHMDLKKRRITCSGMIDILQKPKETMPLSLKISESRLRNGLSYLSSIESSIIFKAGQTVLNAVFVQSYRTVDVLLAAA
jgi:hypothetical protein